MDFVAMCMNHRGEGYLLLSCPPHRVYVRVFTVTFLTAIKKDAHKNNLRKEGLIWTYSLRQTVQGVVVGARHGSHCVCSQ